MYVLTIFLSVRGVLEYSVLFAADLTKTRNGGRYMFEASCQKTFVLNVPSFFYMFVQKC